jgi:hypothetical protein
VPKTDITDYEWVIIHGLGNEKHTRGVIHA